MRMPSDCGPRALKVLFVVNSSFEYLRVFCFYRDNKELEEVRQSLTNLLRELEQIRATLTVHIDVCC